jgi:DNA-binding MarR family transcriptional regulator
VRDKLKEFDISLPQYEALSILRTAGPDGLPSLEVASRMVTRVPDITRLLDRLVLANWITRTRSKDDRRVVQCKLRRRGLELLGRIDQPMTTLHKRILRHFSQAEIGQLTRLLEKVRALEEQ